jgi:hypothetical protein
MSGTPSLSNIGERTVFFKDFRRETGVVTRL